MLHLYYSGFDLVFAVYIIILVVQIVFSIVSKQMFGLMFAPNTAVPLGEGQGTLFNFCLVMLVQTFRAPLRLFISLTPLPRKFHFTWRFIFLFQNGLHYPLPLCNF